MSAAWEENHVRPQTLLLASTDSLFIISELEGEVSIDKGRLQFSSLDEPFSETASHNAVHE